MKLLKLLELNIPGRNCMKTKQELEKTIAETQCKHLSIIVWNYGPKCTECLTELEKQKMIDKSVKSKAHGEYNKKAGMGNSV